MSKKPKKRNKPYRGDDAASSPRVHRYQAVVRSPFGEWWHANKQRIKIGSYVGGGAVVFIWLMVEFFNLVF